MTVVRYERDADGVVTLWLDDPDLRADSDSPGSLTSLHDAVERLHAEVDAGVEPVTGVVMASAGQAFAAGDDGFDVMARGPDDAAAVVATAERVKAPLRRLELLPRPVVAAIGGPALGGGLEIALAANHRIALDAGYDIGLPEVTVGLLPGGGGLTRTVRMFGLVTALSEILGSGTRFRPARALEVGLVDEMVATPDELLPAARAWVLANAGVEAARTRPWDRPGFRIPGGAPSSPGLAGVLPALAPTLRKRLRQADVHAPKAILAAAVEGAQVDFDTASVIESRYLAKLVVGRQSKNLAQALVVDLQSITSGALRPAGAPAHTASRVAVLGAGMMGAGIAHACARAGMQVVLKDVSVEAAERGKAYSAGLNEKAVSRGRLTGEAAQQLLDRITPTDRVGALAGCDLVIEAVFEDAGLKQQVLAEALPNLAAGALLATNTSALPITDLARGVDRPGDLVGLHFFSPVHRMRLVEIVRGADTSDAALAKAYDVVLQLGKTPIVVNDSRGFFTSRVIAARIEEGLSMLRAGVAPYSLERAATQAGYPVGPLQLADELNLELLHRIARSMREAAGDAEAGVTERVMGPLIDAGRPGKLGGAGFFDYAEGTRGSVWSGLGGLFPVAASQLPLRDVQDRLLFREAIETARCFEEGVLTSAAHANVGGILGIGFPAQLGGPAQFVTGYEAADGAVGAAAFVRRADELADAYGEQLRPTGWLRELACSGGSYPA